MKFFSVPGLFLTVFLSLVLIACQSVNSDSDNQNRTPEIEPNAAPNAETDPSPDAFCEQTYTELLRENEQDYVSCLSDLKVDTRSCPKPEGFDDGYKENLNVVIALDASGSMGGKIAGGQKLEIAKKAIASFVETLPERANVGLIVYGHKGSNAERGKQTSCRGIEPVYALKKLEKNEFLRVVDSFSPTGWTPLAGAIDQSAEALNGQSGDRATNLVYVVSDGIETCGGDPVEAARRLHQSDIKAVVNLIGFDVDDAAQRQLREAAEAGGGQYFDAKNADELNKVFGGVSRSVAEYNEYVRCMTANKQDVFRLYGNQESRIFLCVSNKSREESAAIRSTRAAWSRTRDPRAKCESFVIEQQNARELGIKNWRDGILEKIKQKQNVTYEEIERELKSVTEKQAQKIER